MTGPLLLLLVEDDEVDRKLVARTLQRAALDVEIQETVSLAEAREALAEDTSFDCVLLDYRLTDGTALELLRPDEGRDWEGIPAPVVVLTGHAEQALAETCLQAGAQDYLVKGSFDDDALARAIRYARERWQQGQTLQQQARELRRRNLELEEFASIVSHDLQEPLRNASRMASRLQERCADDLDEKSLLYLERLLAAHTRMGSLIRDLLALARVGRVEADSLREVDLEDALRRVLEDLEHRVQSSQADVVLGELAPLYGNPSLIRQLLTNLVGNALKYHEPDVPPRVEVRCARLKRGWSELVVADHGIGFDPKHASMVFMPFKRLKPKDYEGTGIGLAICKRIVELHGGRIHVDAEPGAGATFRCLFPSPVRRTSSARGDESPSEAEPDPQR